MPNFPNAHNHVPIDPVIHWLSNSVRILLKRLDTLEKQSQRQVPNVQKVQETFEVHHNSDIDKYVDAPVQQQRHVPFVTQVSNTVEAFQIHDIDNIVVVPEKQQQQTHVPVITPQVSNTVEGSQIQFINKIVDVEQQKQKKTDANGHSAF